MTQYESMLRLYRVLGEDDSVLNSELKRLGEVIKTRSQLNNDLEYLSVSKINSGDIEGVIVIRGEQDKVYKEVQLLTTLIKSSFKTIDVEDITSSSLEKIIGIKVKNFF
ncbi:MAG: hypothetical protein QXE81_01825 [Desulfurococcaceae archaeon]